jgi:hypothetical protein
MFKWEPDPEELERLQRMINEFGQGYWERVQARLDEAIERWRNSPIHAEVMRQRFAGTQSGDAPLNLPRRAARTAEIDGGE